MEVAARDLVRNYADIRKRLVSPPNAVGQKREDPVVKSVGLPKVEPMRPVTWRFGGWYATPNQIQHEITNMRIREIIKAVCEWYGVTAIDLASTRRLSYLVRARQVAMYLAKNLTLCSFPQIGRVLGGRDHTTVMYGVEKITLAMQSNEELRADIAELTQTILGRK